VTAAAVLLSIGTLGGAVSAVRALSLGCGGAEPPEGGLVVSAATVSGRLATLDSGLVSIGLMTLSTGATAAFAGLLSAVAAESRAVESGAVARPEAVSRAVSRARPGA
jgi:hypothetical protein